MPERPFVHLHCHSHYSLLDGASRIPELVAHVKAEGMTAIALTDHGNLYGAIEFYRACKTAGLNPILGYEAYVAPNKRTDREPRKRNTESDDAIYHHLTLLAKDLTGFKNLIKMASLAFLEGYHYKPRIDKELLENFNEGIICLSGCAAAEFSDYILKDKLDEARQIAAYFAKIFGERFFIEIQNNGLEIQRLCAEGAIDVANNLGLPMVATSDAHYLRQEDSVAHDVLLCINTGRTRDNPNRFKFEGNQFHVRGPEEMYKLFPGHADAVKRSQEIADSVHIELDFKKRHFPVFTPPSGKTPEQYLRELCEQGLIERFGPNPPQAARDRLEHELGIICRMGFASYFLIVSDFVRFAVENNIPASARGSACGSLVSYALRLSHVDPLEYDLLFERFLDPNRSEAPDIDIDFCQDRRDEVIAYVKQKYGEASVAQIATFGTMAARAAIKDVGRALNIPLERVNQLTTMVPQKLGITLDDALRESPDLRQAYESDPEVREVIDVARTLEGTNRNVGTHAAGVVIANGPLTDYVPVHRVVRKGDNGGSRSGEPVVTTQWVMGDLEKVGLLKMDFLGLRTLTLLDNCVRMIEKTRGIKVDIYRLPLDDEETYQLLQRGDAKGVFQFESDGIRELLKRLRPDNIRDIIACTALYRPGPLDGGMVDAYVNRKHGREKPVYQHPVMEEILGTTYGVMCIHEDTRIAMADGAEKPIKHVRRFDRVQSLNLSTRRFEVKECHGAGPTRRCDGLRLTLDNGFAVTLTPDHKVWTYRGWKEVQELDGATDLVAAGVTMTPDMPQAAELAPWLGADEDVAYLLGLLTGDGCLTSSGVTIATGTRTAHDKIVAWLTTRFPGLRVWPYFNVRSWYVNLSHSALLNDPAHGNRKTKLHHLLDRTGLKKKSVEKRVPEVIFRSPAQVRAAYLAGILDSDGCIATNAKGIGVCSVSSASPQLLQNLRRLCQLIGAPVKFYPNRLQVWGVTQLRDQVGPYLVVKSFPAACRSGSTVGWVPREELFAAVPAGESLRGFAARTRIQRRGMANDFPFVKSSTAAKAGIRLGDVRFHRVVSVEVVPDQQFYGMSVADHHNLVANGIVVKNCYQEQVMRILNRLGGIELSSAYACIKAISKKKHDIIEQRRVEFLRGALERGLSEEQAREIFDLITFFGGYGFNASHSTAYSLVSYQTAYLKRHFTAEFMAALLSSEIEDGNKRDVMVDHIGDARKLGVEVVPPNINLSEVEFTVKDGKIIFGLLALKGFGRQAGEEVARVRNEGGPFKDIYDFCERIDHKTVLRAALERLIKAGALDCLGGHRAQLLAALPRAIQGATERQHDLRIGQLNLFDVLGAAETESAPVPSAETLPDVVPWPELEKLKYEKEVLDFYISSHPLVQSEKELRRYAVNAIAQLRTLPDGEEVTIGGMFSQLRFMNVKKARNGNSRMMRCKLEDFTGLTECLMWPDDLIRYKDAVAEDVPLIVKGTVDKKGSKSNEPGLLLTRVLTLKQAALELAKGVQVLMKLKSRTSVIDALAEILGRTRGNCPVFLVVRDDAGRDCILKLGREYAVNPHTIELEVLESLLGPGCVKLV